MNELNKLYSAMLKSWGATIKEDARIVLELDGKEYPIRIDEMDLYLPLSNILDGNVINKVFFHPACENITSKETEVFKIIRKLTSMKLLSVFRSFPAVLFEAAAGDKPKKAWKQETIDMMEPLKAAKPGVRKELAALFARMHVELEEDGLDNRFIHFSVSKGGGRSVGTGEKVYYKTKPLFPMYNEIAKRLARSEGQSNNQMVELNNHSVSIAALKLAVHLFQSILPAVVSPSDYEYEATNHVGARLVSYLGCYNEIVEQLNRVQTRFRAEFDKMGIYPIDTSWMEYLESLPETYRQVPILDYNSHNTQEENPSHGTHHNQMAGLLSVSSGGNQHQNNQQPIAHQHQQQRTVGDYDTTPPPMFPGDRYVRTDIDYNAGRVLHQAVSANGTPVIYHCSKFGNYLQRVETSPMNNMMNGGMNGMMMMPGMGMVPGMGMMPGNGMMYVAQPATAGAITPSVFPDNGSSSLTGSSW